MTESGETMDTTNLTPATHVTDAPVPVKLPVSAVQV